jgi:putative ABC transport system permease protein
MARATLDSLNTEIIRMPYVMTDFTFSLAATVVLAAAVVSSLLVRERLDKLDLVEVLKTRE